MKHDPLAASPLEGTHLALVLVAGELRAWQVTTAMSVRSLPLQGQMHLPIIRAQSLSGAVTDVMERLRDEGIHPVAVHWLMDASGRRLLAAAPGQNGSEDFTDWQILSWEWLLQRFGMPDEKLSASTEQLEQEILPWLIHSDTSEERRRRLEALGRDHQNESQRLASERARLLQENEHLRASNEALQQVDAERLVSFLPALYPRVFTLLGPVDLALLCGRLEPLSIPNPYPEPSEEALRTLQKRFRDLPHHLQGRIVGFVARLPQRQKLVVRPEMRALINELEGI